MNPVGNYPSFTPPAFGTFADERIEAQQTRVGVLSQKQSTDLTIITDEGDTVTLSMASAMETNAGIHGEATYGDGRIAANQSVMFESSRSRSLSIEIDGDLNEAELEDIREAVSTIGAMIDDFFSGDLKEMAKEAELLKELDSINSLEAAFSYERQALYAQQDKVEISRPSTESERPDHRRGRGGLRRLMGRMDRLTDDLAEQVRGFHGRRNHLARSVRELLGHYRDDQAEGAREDELRQQVIQTTQSLFAQKIQTMTESASFILSYAA
jgi:hypothetical protein